MLVVVAIRKGVDVGVVDQGVVAISPGELLGPENKKFNVSLLHKTPTVRLLYTGFYSVGDSNQLSR